jgi:hypothetical protein|tara:strand:+ start:334 stop:546 length:213 start_codon:yes stop_codon:yes gene_type:complete
MKLSNQALGALMMALQKSLMEQSDLVPVLKEFNFMFDPDDSSHSTLMVDNPPVIHLDGVELNDANTAFED